MEAFIFQWLPEADRTIPLNRGSRALRKRFSPRILEHLPWADYPYHPRVQIWAGWGPEEILLHYRVTEARVKAEWVRINDPVCRDSCVEFFIDPGDGTYFNFEFNPIGTGYLARGHSREDRVPLEEAQVARIRRIGSLGTLPFAEREGETSWTLTVGIPLDLFADTALAAPSGKKFRGNFYKCGDDLRIPHYVTWHPVETEEPDFHRPECFGTIVFAPKTGEKGLWGNSKSR